MALNPWYRSLADGSLTRLSWQPGWTVQDVVGSRTVVTRNGLSLWVRSSYCAVEGGDSLPGRSAAILLPAVSAALSPGFLVFNGASLPLPGHADTLVRIYWNLCWEAAGELVGHLAAGLDGSKIGHVVKIINVPSEHYRCDAAVLLLTASTFPDAAPVLRSVADRLYHDLRPGTPAFTQEIARGVGVAECSNSGASFGQQRCTALASAIVETDAAHAYASTDARFDAILAHLRTSGFRPEAPHLNHGSTTNYVLPSVDASARRRQIRQRAHGQRTALSVATLLARRLCDDAIWDGGRCGWVGFTSGEVGGYGRPTFRALGPDLAEGTSGIALFLAATACQLGDERAFHTALAAVRTATAMADTECPQPGLYLGAIGVAFAAARIGATCGQPDLLDTASALARRGVGSVQQCSSPDLVGGHAGQIVGLLAVARMLADPDLVTAAVRWGEGLIGAAQRHKSGVWSWSSSARRRRRGLTGMAHGAAGIGLALAELYASTHDDRFCEAALRAFAYERLWFSSAHGNWPDLQAAVRRRAVYPEAYRHEWRYGAPGIALTRLRAFAVLNQPILHDEAITGLSSTLRAARELAHAGPTDYSLCHGVSGLADVLLVGMQYGEGNGSEVKRVVANTIRGCAPYLNGQRAWPCGVAGAEVPGLLLGLAGIGYSHLRLRNPDMIPSILLPTMQAPDAGSVAPAR
jgi:hypothetical protein